MVEIKKVLVVDDSKLARLTLIRLLKKMEIVALEAESVDQGIDILRNEHVDAVFLDVQMPEKSGFEALKEIKKDSALKHLPCSMYSGDLSVEAQDEAINKGAHAYLFKPANVESLNHVIHALATNIASVEVEEYTLTSGMEIHNESQARSKAQPNLTIKHCEDIGIVNTHDETTVEKTNAHHMTRSPAERKALQVRSAKHKKAIQTLDGRTRNLARLLNKEKQEKEKAIEALTKQLNNATEDVDYLKEELERKKGEELMFKNQENDIRGQLKQTRRNLKLAFTIGIASVILGGIAMFFAVMNFMK